MIIKNLARFSLAISAFTIFLAATPIAAMAGPNDVSILGGGTVVAGYYTQPLTLQFQEHPWTYSGGGGAPGDSCQQVINWQDAGVYLFNIEGAHRFRLLRNSYNVNFVQIDNQDPKIYGEIIKNKTQYPACDQYRNPPPKNLIYDNTFKLDLNNPIITITSPANNANLPGNRIVVKGSASDTGSGVKAVTVNGVAAKLSGTSYSVKISLAKGPNTIVATAIDNTDRSQIAQITIFKSADKTNQPLVNTIIEGVNTHKTESVLVTALLVLIVIMLLMLLERFGFIKFKLPEPIKTGLNFISKRIKG